MWRARLACVLIWVVASNSSLTLAQISADLTDARAALGGRGFSSSHYDEWAAKHARTRLIDLVRTCNSWYAACELARIPSRGRVPNAAITLEFAADCLSRAIIWADQRGALTESRYREWRTGRPDAPTPEAVVRHYFADWGEAVRYAGGQPGRTPRMSGADAVAQMHRDMRAVAAQLAPGEVFSSRAYVRLRRPGAPHRTQVANAHGGSWAAAVRAAGLASPTSIPVDATHE
jgi:hypothetical protein